MRGSMGDAVRLLSRDVHFDHHRAGAPFIPELVDWTCGGELGLDSAVATILEANAPDGCERQPVAGHCRDHHRFASFLWQLVKRSREVGQRVALGRFSKAGDLSAAPCNSPGHLRDGLCRRLPDHFVRSERWDRYHWEGSFPIKLRLIMKTGKT